MIQSKLHGNFVDYFFIGFLALILSIGMNPIKTYGIKKTYDNYTIGLSLFNDSCYLVHGELLLFLCLF